MALTHVLGDVPATRILDFMLGHIEYDCTPKEVAEYADVAPSAVKRDIARLVECGVVNETRKIGGVQLYILNNDSAVVNALFELDRVISGDVPDPDDGDAKDVLELTDKYPEPGTGGHLCLEVITDASQTTDDDATSDPKKYPEPQEEWSP